jgi:hypothetical protein
MDVKIAAHQVNPTGRGEELKGRNNSATFRETPQPMLQVCR